MDQRAGATAIVDDGVRSVRVRVNGDARNVPSYQSAGAVGADLRAALREDLILAPGARALVATGVRLEIPPGFEAQVRPRSGLAVKHGLTVVNAPGTIDSDYRGELAVALINFGAEPVRIEPGMRIAQLVVAPVVRADFVVVERLSDSGRGAGGFGSTGAT